MSDNALTQFALAVGGNRGQVELTATQAEQQLELVCTVVARSSWYRTAAVTLPGSAPQPDYLNAVWIIATAFGPHQLWDRLIAAEHAGGRTRTLRWGARTLDLDLIACADGRQVHSAVLTIPHPRWRERAFVAVPFAEVAPTWIDPVSQLTVAAIAARHTLPPRSRQA